MERRARGVTDECRGTAQSRLHRINPCEKRREFRVFVHALVVARGFFIALRFDARGPLRGERANGVGLTVRLTLERLGLRVRFGGFNLGQRVLHFGHAREHAHRGLLRQNHLRQAHCDRFDTSLLRAFDARENRFLGIGQARARTDEFIEIKTRHSLHRARERLLEILRSVFERTSVTHEERLRIRVGGLHLPEEIRLHHHLQTIARRGLHQRTLDELLAPIDLGDRVDEEGKFEVQTCVALDSRGNSKAGTNRDLMEVHAVSRAVKHEHGHDGKSKGNG